jgi:hypothetical protein
VFTKLLGLQYNIVYKKGAENLAADALSRRPQVPTELCMVSTITPWLQIVQNSYENDEMVKSILSKLVLSIDAVPNYKLQNGILKYKDRIWVGCDSSIQKQIISALHDSTVGGHLGAPVTYNRFKKMFTWKGLKSDVQEFVKHFQVCIQAKADRTCYPCKLQPLNVH